MFKESQSRTPLQVDEVVSYRFGKLKKTEMSARLTELLPRAAWILLSRGAVSLRHDFSLPSVMERIVEEE
jgi:hypothetical protein